MAARVDARPMPDAYFELIGRFPLIPIRDDEHLDEALGVIDGLLQEALDEGGQAYLDVLTGLVEDYEDANVPIPDASEADVLRVLMQSHGLSQTALAKKAGISQSTISAVLNGTRSLTKSQVVALSRFFNVSTVVFMPA